MPSIGPAELLVVLVVALLVVGPRRLPGLSRQLGTGMRELRDSLAAATPSAERARQREAGAG